MERTYYVFDDQFFYTGESSTISEYETWPVRSTFVKPPELQSGEFAKWNGSKWMFTTGGPKEPIPASVTKRQGRQQMILMGVINAVQPAIDAIEDDVQRALVQSFWDDSSDYERDHPQMVELGAAIGLSTDQIDDAFRAASKL